MAVGLPEPDVPRPIPGLRLGVAPAGVRYRNRDDLAVLCLPDGARVALALTTNAFAAAPVQVCRDHLASDTPTRALLINSGNANAGTGAPGLAAARKTCQALAQRLGVDETAVLPFSTGVIGEAMPAERIVDALDAALAGATDEGWLPAARAIMTTDSAPKLVSRCVTLGGREFTVTGMAKGAGMIRPDMATMLAYIATDLPLDQAATDAILRDAVDASFHCITVDGDTSTNDACALIATGAIDDHADTVAITTDSADYALAREVVTEVCQALAQRIVRDGEGATKFVTLQVSGAIDVAEARHAALTVAQSPLVKTAWFASDPNWGRMLAAVGRSGLDGLQIADVDLRINDVAVLAGGEPVAGYVEADAKAAMSQPEFTVHIALGRGAAQARVWSCDLGHDYVRINAEYRT